MDKTDEFRELLQANHCRLTTSSYLEEKLIYMENTSNDKFLLLAGDIYKKIEILFDTLKKLERTVKDSTIFINPEREIEDLSSMIQQVVKNVKFQIEVLKGEKASTTSANKTNSQVAHAIIDILSIKLFDITKKFKDLLQLSSNKIKQFESRKKDLSSVSVRNKFKKSKWNSNKEIQYSGIPEDEEENYGQNSELKMENMSAETQNIEKIEIRLGEIGKIFQQIGEMAEMQRIMIERIDTDTENALINLEKGKEELMKTYKREANVRALVIKLFVIIILFSVAYILFAAQIGKYCSQGNS